MKYICLILMVIIVSCSQNKYNKEILNLIERKIELVDTLPRYNPKTESYYDTIKNSNIKYKFVVYINGDCFTCVEDLVEWNNIIKELERYDVDFLFYMHTSQIDVIQPYLRRWRFNHDIIVDQKNAFFIKNNISSKKLYQTMLLDKNNKVIMIGNPLYNDKLIDLYKQVLAQN